jgi:hypothetical protein
MEIGDYFKLIVMLNTADSIGLYDDITAQDIWRHIEKGDLVSYLEVRLPKTVNFSMFENRLDLELMFTSKLQALLPSCDGQPERNLRAKNSGLGFLISLILGLIRDFEPQKQHYVPTLRDRAGFVDVGYKTRM